MESAINYSNLSALAKALQKSIAVYDLETTTFRGKPNFGITEVSCFVVPQSGDAVTFGGLINPQEIIDSKVVELTGITQSMVANKETWGQRYAKLFQQMAHGECWLCGFNNSTFDDKAIIDMGAKYGAPIDAVKYSFDVRNLHLELSAAQKRSGKLGEVSGLYGVVPRGNLHRAKADTVLTVETLNAIIDVYGLPAVLALIQPAPEGAADKLSAVAVAKYVKARPKASVHEIAAAFKQEVPAVSFEVGKAIDERLVDAQVFANPEVQSWLTDALIGVSNEILQKGQLRPILNALAQDERPPLEMDYIQLRVGLLNMGLAWNSLKPM